MIYHNTLDLNVLYSGIKSCGYKQVARSGGNDIFFLRQAKNSKKTPIENISELNRLFVNSEYSLQRAIEAGLDKTCLSVVKGGCAREDDAPTVNETYQSPVIVSCCRLVDFKGLEDAIDACRLLDQKGMDFTYLIIGEGQLKEALQSRIENHGLAGKCHLIGSRSLAQVQGYYRAADIYLSTSVDLLKTRGGKSYTHTETMGRSLCEAQAWGLPVVSTNAGGSPEMVWDGFSGFVVQQGDITAIANRLAELISNEKLRADMGIHAKEYSDTLSWNAVCQHFLHDISLVNALPSKEV